MLSLDCRRERNRPFRTFQARPAKSARYRAPMKELYLATVDAVRPLLDHPELDKRWASPSSLERMTVGELTAHLARAVTIVPGYLETDGDPPLRDAAGYILALFPEADNHPDSDLSIAVRQRASTDAGPGPESVRDSWDRARADLGDRLSTVEADKTIAVRGSSMAVDDYLQTRMVELVVHGDDLADSLGVPPPEFPPAITDVVLDCLVALASRRADPLSVIRAMTRTERGDPEVLRVF